jgi:short-subunit dehydrogenase
MLDSAWRTCDLQCMRPVTVITGASAGIGAALARVFAANGHELVLVARREHKLGEVAAEIEAAGRPTPLALPIDLTSPNGAAWIGQALAARGLEPQYVVNNAGFGLVGQAHSLDLAAQLAMIDLNMRTLTDLSLTFVESLVRHRGGLLNVASVAGFFPGPRSAVYYASKAFVLSLSEALHVELKPRGVRVTCLCPGPVATEFQSRAGIVEAAPPRLFVRSAEQVADAGYQGLMRGRRVVVPGFANKLVSLFAPRAPRGLLMAALNARQSRRQASLEPGA